MDASRQLEAARAAVLDYFRADPAEYGVIFTPNASGALKLVGESYPFEPGSRYLLTYDNHNSVNGIREFARHHGARVTYVPVVGPNLRVEADSVLSELDTLAPGVPHLFAYPAQSNFSGVQHPLEWVARAHERGWHVLLDCAAFVPTNRLDLSVVQPDFVPLSFYKMFGYPTGIGALLYRHRALRVLRRPWFAGGTITVTSVQGEGWHHLAPGHAGFEDGTVDYLGLPAVVIGLEHLATVGIDTIHRARDGAHRVAALAADLGRAFEWSAPGAGVRTDRSDGARRDDRLPPAGAGRRAVRRARRRAAGGCCAHFAADGMLLQSRRRGGGARDQPRRHGAVFRRHVRPCDVRGLQRDAPRVDRQGAQHDAHLPGAASNFADAYAFIVFAERFRDVAGDRVSGPPSPATHGRTT